MTNKTTGEYEIQIITECLGIRCVFFLKIKKT